MSRDDFARASHGGQNENKPLLQRHKGEFRYVGISAQQRLLRCGQNLRGLSWELYCRIMHSSDGGQRGDKRIHNSTTKVIFCTIIIRLCHCVIAITRV